MKIDWVMVIVLVIGIISMTFMYLDFQERQQLIIEGNCAAGRLGMIHGFLTQVNSLEEHKQLCSVGDTNCTEHFDSRISLINELFNELSEQIKCGEYKA